MSQQDKLLDRFLSKPKDLTWDEFKRLMKSLGYEEAAPGKTGGSRRRFTSDKFGPIILHKPHPGNELKAYQIAQVIAFLRDHGVLRDRGF